MNNNNNNNGSRGMGEVAPLFGVDCTGPHQPRCGIVQFEAQAIHFFAHKTVRA